MPKAVTESGFSELFNLLFPEERADLDFGLYRLLNARRESLSRFFVQDLPVLLDDLARRASADNDLENELTLLRKKAEELRIAIEQIPRYAEVQSELAQSGSAVLVSETLRHLRAFIGRYYVDGDFIPMRRYRSDAYLLPYDGSETAFVYANQDQYFTKSEQVFDTFRVRLPDERRVTCTVSYAEERLGNNEDSTKQKRRYKLSGVEITESDVILSFAFVPSEKATQDILTTEAVSKIQEQTTNGPWFSELFRSEKGKPWVALLIDRFTKNAERDFFVHRNLKRFLDEELDRYVFTDVFPRATVRDDNTLRIASRVELALRGIAAPLITLLAQFEDIQRDLWTKPRLVTQTAYCTTLDRLPTELVEIAVANEAQREEWKALFGVAPDAEITAESHPGLFVDTRNFDDGFFAEVERSLPEGDRGVDGLVIISENTAALRTYSKRLAHSIDAIYIDPPFNTGSGSSFRYKNGYQHSSWCCLMEDAIALGGHLLTEEGVMAIAIDDAEVARLQMIADRVLGEQRRLGTQIFVTKHGGRSRDRFLATSHEYALYYASAEGEASVSFSPLTEEQKAEYKFVDSENNRYKWRDFMRTGGTSFPHERQHSHYQIYWHPPTNAVVVFADPDAKTLLKSKAKKGLEMFLALPGTSKRGDLGTEVAYVFDPNGAGMPDLGEFIKIDPLDSSGVQRVWRKTRIPFMLHAAKGEILFTEDGGRYKVNIKDPEKLGTRPNSVADDKAFNATAYGTNLLKEMFGESRVFSYPKALGTVKRALEQMVGDDEEAVVADYFAGSGTTGHAVMEMNREGGSRRYILVEMAEYVDDVTIKRLMKAAYSSAWSKGLPTKVDSLSHTLKIVQLESYEDTLENVSLKPVEERETAMEMFPEFRRELVPTRLLRDDVRASNAYLPAAALAGGSVEISTLDHDGKRRDVHVDLSETLSIWLGIEAKRRDRLDGITLTLGWVGETPVALVMRSSEKIDSAVVATALRAFVGETKIEKLIVNGDIAIEALRKQGFDVEVQTVEESIIGAR